MPESIMETGVHSNVLKPELEEDAAFLAHLRAEVETPLDTTGASKPSRTDALEQLKKHKDAPTKADLYEFDRLALELASDEEVQAEAPALYQRYCQERGETIDPKDPAMNPPASDDAEREKKMAALRARMLQLLRALHWSYTFGPMREQRRITLIKDAMWVMAAATVILGGLALFLRNGDLPFFAVLTTVVYAGVMGAMVSCLRRLGGVPTKDDALKGIYALKNARYVLIFAPLTGGVFAVVTMLLFMGGVMKGTLFPVFPELTPVALVSGKWQFTSAFLPSNNAGYALLFLWCFIAGFAERLIPDTLDELTKHARTQKVEPAKEAPRI